MRIFFSGFLYEDESWIIISNLINDPFYAMIIITPQNRSRFK